MEWLWILAIVVLLFCIFIIVVMYRLMYIKGYKAGGMKVLNEWKAYMNEEETDNEKLN